MEELEHSNELRAMNNSLLGEMIGQIIRVNAVTHLPASRRRSGFIRQLDRGVNIHNHQVTFTTFVTSRPLGMDAVLNVGGDFTSKTWRLRPSIWVRASFKAPFQAHRSIHSLIGQSIHSLVSFSSQSKCHTLTLLLPLGRTSWGLRSSYLQSSIKLSDHIVRSLTKLVDLRISSACLRTSSFYPSIPGVRQ